MAQPIVITLNRCSHGRAYESYCEQCVEEGLERVREEYAKRQAEAQANTPPDSSVQKDLDS